MANLPDMKTTKNVRLAILALASGSALMNAQEATSGVIKNDAINAPKLLTIGDAKSFSELMVKANAADIEIQREGKVFFVVNGLAIKKTEAELPAGLWPSFLPPAKADQVSITLTTEDGKQWRAKWEEIPAK